ncbi:MAG: alpha/beta fold hydrolase [Pseudomonadota bacterium]
MRERVVQFPEDGRLSGVISEGPASVGALFLNAGVVRRVGVHRLNVKLARALGDLGFPSLRFDLSGQGDSVRPARPLGPADQAIDDLREAADALCEAAALEGTIGVGMCSGADNAVRAALRNPRFKGLVLLDPYAYPTRRAAAADVFARVSDPARWARKSRALLGGQVEAPPNDSAQPVYDQGRPVPPREVFGADLRALADRGVKILIVYTGFVKRLVSHPDHFYSAFKDFDLAAAVDVEVFADTDHTFTQLIAQENLIALIAGWVNENFGAPGERV